jgi:hypothetical protein
MLPRASTIPAAQGRSPPPVFGLRRVDYVLTPHVLCSGGGGGGGLAQSAVREGPPTGYMDPVQYMDSQAHSRFVRDTKTAEDMYTHNYKVNVPCSWGIKCQLHVRPTLRERTGGAWLGEGPVTPLAKVRTERLTGPWEQKFAKNLPQPAGNGWGDVDRAIGAPYLGEKVANAKRVKKVSAPTKAYYADPHDEMVLGQRTKAHALASLHYDTPGAAGPSQQPQADAKEDKEEAKLEKQAAAIKANMAKMVSDYGSAAIETDNGYHP